jgi:hypothetical protein
LQFEQITGALVQDSQDLLVNGLFLKGKTGRPGVWSHGPSTAAVFGGLKASGG